MSRALAFAVLLFASLQQHLSEAQEDESLTYEGDPLVKCQFGSLRGKYMKSRSGKDYRAFLGIKYAKAPVGELRFEPPVPNDEKWDGVKDFKEDGPACPQATNMLQAPSSEDCLYLNVFTPKDHKTGTRLPVIFWIHHGAFSSLSSLSTLTGADYWMDKEVALVMINFRLGAFGFLSTGDNVVPGNMGYKDQLLALKWVRDNIKCFGGDPKLVTLIGYSSGGGSANMHMASKASKGLFHRAISMGGTALCKWALIRNPREILQDQARILNCPYGEGATSKQIVDCLRKKDAEEIAKSYFKLQPWLYSPIMVYSTVIEPPGTKDPFLQDDPKCIFTSGNYNQVPWMTGTTSNEFMNLAAIIVQNSTATTELATEFHRIAPIAFYYERGTCSSLQKSKKIKQFYFPDDRLTTQYLVPIEEMLTDATFMFCADLAIKLISKTSKHPAYYYVYSHVGKYSEMTTQQGLCKEPGAVHHDDLTYLFYRRAVSPLLNDSSYETTLSKKLVRMFYNFAVTGNPTPPYECANNDDFIWKPHTPEDRAYLEIGDNGFKMKLNYRQARAAIWEKIYHSNEYNSTCHDEPPIYQCKNQENCLAMDY